MGPRLGASCASTAKKRCSQHPESFGACTVHSCHESTKHGSRHFPDCSGVIRVSFVMVTRAVTTLWTCPAWGKPWEPSKAKGFHLQSSPRSSCCIQASPLDSSDLKVVVPDMSPPPPGHETCPCSAVRAQHFAERMPPQQHHMVR